MTDRISRMQSKALKTRGIVDRNPFFWNKEIAIMEDSLLAIEPDSAEFISDYEETNYDVVIRLSNPLWHPAGNHGSCDYRTFVNHGISYYQSLIHKTGDSEYLNRMRECCDHILSFAGRYKELAGRMAETEKEPGRKTELENMAKRLQRVPFYGASTFTEAVQSYWIAFYLFRDGIGRLDSYLEPFFRQDLQMGRITEEQALEWIEELLIKIFSVLGCNNPRSADNHMVLGGRPEGMTSATRLILKALEELDIYRPQATFRWFQEMPYEHLREAVQVHIKRNDRLMFINDDVMLKGFEKMGISHTDAMEYSLSGCSEAIITGMSQMGSVEGFLNLMTPFMTAYQRGAKSYEEFYQAVLKELEKSVFTIMEESYKMDQERSRMDIPLESLTIQNCIAAQKGYRGGGAKYNFCNWCLIGFCELVDSLSIVKDLVFTRKLLDFDVLRKATDSDFAEYEDLRKLIQTKGRFFGNDDDFADQIAVDLVERLYQLSLLRTPFRGGQYNFGTLAGIENMHVVFGKATGATPDGRKSGESFAASLSVTKNKDKNGPTALLRSLAKIDFTKMPSSVVTNITLSSDLLQGEENIDRIAHLILGYFEMGGVQLQINYLSKEQLIQAQFHPEEYMNLRVRVTGYSGYFTKMDKALQNEIINRTVVHL